MSRCRSRASSSTRSRCSRPTVRTSWRTSFGWPGKGRRAGSTRPPDRSRLEGCRRRGGGDGSGTFNISTTSALVVAATGVPVAKHGNRAITSKAGSADVLDELGVRVDHDAASAGRALAEYGFAFLFAPNFHPAMKHAGPTRREIGVRTAFNLLGPLTNPAGATRGLFGVADPVAAPKVAEMLRALETARALVIHGEGVDEL